jgi:hypothetical protein
VFSTLRGEISASRVADDVRTVLDAAGWEVEIDASLVTIDRDVPLEVVARSCHTYERKMSFGDHYRVLVAVGGIRTVANGVPEANLCFATVWYTPALELITIDFYSKYSSHKPL